MEYKLVDKIINELLEWKFFRNGFYELSEEDEYGYMKYAIEQDNHIFDDWQGEHPEYLQ